MSHTNKKRSFSESDLSSSQSQSDQSDNEPPLKKRKLNLFSEYDHQRFLLLFQLINESQLINKLNVPSNINQIIAEYSTGSVSNCANHKCSNKVIQLEIDYENGIYNSSKYYLGDYCIDCAKYVEYCNCCDQYIYLKHCNKCSYCDQIKFFCRHLQVSDDDESDNSDIDEPGVYHFGLQSIECNQCNKGYICEDCIKVSKCNLCKNIFCDQCIDETHTGKWKAYQCDFCDNFVPKRHQNCINMFYDQEGLFTNCIECGSLVCDECNDVCELCNKTLCNECYENQYQYILCDVCGLHYPHEHCSIEWMIDLCEECGNTLCRKCSILCKNCDQIICEKCIIDIDDHDINDNLFECIICDNYVPRLHKSCILDDNITSFTDLTEFDFMQCEQNGCNNYICLNCIYPKLEITECINCGDIDVLNLCIEHKEKKNQFICKDYDCNYDNNI